MIEKEIVICLGKAQESAGGSGGGSSNYSDLTNKPKINGNILVGNKTSSQLGLQSELTAGEGITIETSGGATTISATGVIAIDDELSTTSEFPVQNKVITNALNNRVEKETGKGLSSNDFTNGDKAKLDNIMANAEVNTISSISKNGTALSPDANKNVDIAIPTKTSDLVNDNNTVTDANYVHTDNNYTTADKEKLGNLGTASRKNYTTTISQNGENLPTDGAVYTELAKKINIADRGIANGIAELDENGRVLASQMPGAIDEIVNGYYYNGNFYRDQAHTRIIIPGDSKIYIDLETNKQYRWSGEVYVEISASLALGITSSTAGRGDWTKIAYDHSLLIEGNPHNVTKNDLGLGNVDNTSDLDKPLSTAAENALNTKMNVNLLPTSVNQVEGVDAYMTQTSLPHITNANDIKYKYGMVSCNGQAVSNLPSTDYYNVHVEYVDNDPHKIIQVAIKASTPVEHYSRYSNDLGQTWSEWQLISGSCGDPIEYVSTLPTSDIKNIIYGIKETTGQMTTINLIKPMAGQLTKQQAIDYFSKYFTVTEESSTRLSLSVYPDLVLSRDLWTQDYKAADGDIVTLKYLVDTQELSWTNSSSQETSTGAWSTYPIRCTSAYFPTYKYYAGVESTQELNEIGAGGSGEISDKYKKIFNGTLEGWNALTTEEKKEYDNVSTPDPTSGSALVDAVENGNMNAVTSNAVFNAIHGLLSRDTTQGVNDLNNAVAPGVYAISPSISNAPITGMYGSVLVFGQKTDKPSSTSQWIWQLAVSTDNNYNGAVWIRHSVNSNSLTPTNWSTWEQIGQGYFNGLTTVGTAFDTTYQDGSGSKGYDIIESGLYKFHVYLENSSPKSVNQCQISLYNSGTLVGVLYDYNYSGQNSLTVEGYMRIKSGQNITVTHVGAGGGVGGRCYFTLHKVNEIY